MAAAMGDYGRTADAVSDDFYLNFTSIDSRISNPLPAIRAPDSLCPGHPVLESLPVCKGAGKQARQSLEVSFEKKQPGFARALAFAAGSRSYEEHSKAEFHIRMTGVLP